MKISLQSLGDIWWGLFLGIGGCLGALTNLRTIRRKVEEGTISPEEGLRQSDKSRIGVWAFPLLGLGYILVEVISRLAKG